LRILRARQPVRGDGQTAGAALQLGVSEQFGQFRLVAGGQQGQPVQRTGNRRAPGGQRVALARPARDLKGGLLNPFEVAKTGRSRRRLSARTKQDNGPELAVDQAGLLQRRGRLEAIRAVMSAGSRAVGSNSPPAR
jgi:hypothetical protein